MGLVLAPRCHAPAGAERNRKTVFQNMKPIGGMLMAMVLLMGALSPQSFMEAAGTVTVTREMLHRKGSQCRLYVEGKPHELTPGTYQNALLLVQENDRQPAARSGKPLCHYGLYVDA